jgi:uncharacterized protein (DUF1330 family)
MARLDGIFRKSAIKLILSDPSGEKLMVVRCAFALTITVALFLGAAAIYGLRAATVPPVYLVIAVEEVTDAEAFKRDFVDKGPAGIVEAKFADARFIARTGNIVPLDGPAPRFVVILSFQNMKKAQAYNESMKELTALRQKTTKSRSFIVEGL